MNNLSHVPGEMNTLYVGLCMGELIWVARYVSFRPCLQYERQTYIVLRVLLMATLIGKYQYNQYFPKRQILDAQCKR